jgi:hypothetical protein
LKKPAQPSKSNSSLLIELHRVLAASRVRCRHLPPKIIRLNGLAEAGIANVTYASWPMDLGTGILGTVSLGLFLFLDAGLSGAEIV